MIISKIVLNKTIKIPIPVQRIMKNAINNIPNNTNDINDPSGDLQKSIHQLCICILYDKL